MGVCRSKPISPAGPDSGGAAGKVKHNQVAPDAAAAEATAGAGLKLTLLVVGLDDAGKTSCVNALRKEPQARALPTSGFSKPQKIKLGEHSLTLLDLGGGRRIRDIWREYYAEVHALLYVVDASDRERATEAAEALSTAAHHEYVTGKPVLVVANKADKPNGFSLDELRDLVALPGDAPAPVQYVSGRANAGEDGAADTAWLFDGVAWLVNAVREGFDELNARVERETEAKKEANRQKVAAQKAKIESDDWKAGKVNVDGSRVEEADAGAGAAGAGADGDAAAAPAAAAESAAKEEENAGPLCTICKTAPAERRCAAAKWEAVCNPCGEQLEGKV